jgi:hypothetical protein
VGQLKLDWLRGFMKLEQGIPSHDTLARVFGLISPDEFEAAFRRWVGMVIPALAQDTVVAIDGKTSRRSHNKKDTDAHPLHLVSASPPASGLYWGRRPPKRSPMRSPPSPSCSRPWRSRGRS